MPSCAAARPGVCPCCGAAAQPLGGPLVLVGHGLVERQVLGPQAPGEAPVQVVVKLRRYRCRACQAVVMVGPRGLVRGRWYGAGAIAQALALYARGATSALVRPKTSPWQAVGGLGEGALGDVEALGRSGPMRSTVWRGRRSCGAGASRGGRAGHAHAGRACRARFRGGAERERVCGSSDRGLSVP